MEDLVKLFRVVPIDIRRGNLVPAGEEQYLQHGITQVRHPPGQGIEPADEPGAYPVRFRLLAAQETGQMAQVFEAPQEFDIALDAVKTPLVQSGPFPDVLRDELVTGVRVFPFHIEPLSFRH